MTKLIVDKNLQAKLNNLQEKTELCDEAGRTLGILHSEAEYRKIIYALAESQCPYSEEEIRQHAEEPGGCTLAEIWQRLGQK